jgi:hypothetical protein
MSEKIENATMNRNWIWNGKMYIDILTWNEAIEAAAKDLENRYNNHGWNYHLPSVGREGAFEIRKLKK